MKNLLHETKLRKQEKKVADVIALPIALVLIILYYLIKVITRFLVKFKKQLFRLSVSVFVLYGLTTFFIQVASAPKADASTPYASENNYQPTEGWSGFVKAVHTIAPMYNYPANVILAQCALESQRGNSQFAKERNNFCGIGAYDSDPNQAFTFENAEQCIIAYIQLIKRNFPEAWEQRENPDMLLELLKENSKGNYYASDPNYVAKVKSMKEWK